ncbi:hypothetical protein [Microterricola viridarii]|uniref:Uncharacterized protein n=1 Tax=Microterricola viridarii TaxID=412690 RepID=A0A1H1YHD9_9MICO|nr:hypothetical protein [Microterricola viridarii]SDT20842.1 hypothetical protein SAMN04489834_3086 [Microterricola viridarii]
MERGDFATEPPETQPLDLAELFEHRAKAADSSVTLGLDAGTDEG